MDKKKSNRIYKLVFCMLFTCIFVIISGVMNWNGGAGSSIIKVYADPAAGTYKIKANQTLVENGIVTFYLNNYHL